MFFDDFGIMFRLVISPYFTMIITIVLISTILMISVNKKIAKTYMIAITVYIIFTILLILLFGCFIDPANPVETFENPDKSKPKIDKFSQEILDDAEQDVVDAAKIAKYIQDDKLSKESLDMIIQTLGTKAEKDAKETKEPKK